MDEMNEVEVIQISQTGGGRRNVAEDDVNAMIGTEDITHAANDLSRLTEVETGQAVSAWHGLKVKQIEGHHRTARRGQLHCHLSPRARCRAAVHHHRTRPN